MDYDSCHSRVFVFCFFSLFVTQFDSRDFTVDAKIPNSSRHVWGISTFPSRFDANVNKSLGWESCGAPPTPSTYTPGQQGVCQNDTTLPVTIPRVSSHDVELAMPVHRFPKSNHPFYSRVNPHSTPLVALPSPPMLFSSSPSYLYLFSFLLPGSLPIPHPYSLNQ